MKRAIVCGGAGFVGSAVVRELVAQGIEVTVVVRPGFSLLRGRSRLAEQNISVLECDLQAISQIKKLVGRSEPFDVWYQFAWDGLFNEQLYDYTLQIQNIRWTMDALLAAASLGCKKFVGAGSISQLELGIQEFQPSQYDKHRIYKVAKQACEQMGQSVAQIYNIEFIWPIITNIYGPGERSPRLINSTIRNLLQGKCPSFSEGYQIYDFIYLTDAAKAFWRIGEAGKPFRRYVIASGAAQPLRNFLLSLRDIVSPDTELEFGKSPFNGIYLPKEAYDIGTLQHDTGFVPKVSFSQGIKQTAQWILSNMSRDALT